MKRFKKVGPLLRSAAVLGVLGVTVTGITFAALQSHDATMSGSTISSATADLLIGSAPNSVAASMTGINFSNVAPSDDPDPANDHQFYLANDGTTDMDLKMAIGPGLQIPSGIDPTEVWFVITAPNNSSQRKISLADLDDSYNKGYTDLNWIIPHGATNPYQIQAVIGTKAITSSPVSGLVIGNINLVFSGTSYAV